MKRKAGRRGALLALGMAFALVAGCGDPPPAAAPKRGPAEPSWADVFDGVPDLYVVVRPRALKKDAVYGSFWTALVRAAQARGFARGDTMVEAVEGAEELIVGLNRGLDAAIILRGVPANLDPSRMNDSEGHPLFRAVNDRGKIREFALERRNTDGGLFVLPDRTWVGALGEARARARQAFVTPSGRPAPKVDPSALVIVRVQGPLAHVFDKHPLFGPSERKLTSATFTLEPWKGGLVLALDYADADATAWGEMQAKRVAEELSRDEKRFGWLKSAKIAYEGNTVFVRAPIPPRLLEELPNASGADLSL